MDSWVETRKWPLGEINTGGDLYHLTGPNPLNSLIMRWNPQINEDKIPCLGWDWTRILLFTRLASVCSCLQITVGSSTYGFDSHLERIILSWTDVILILSWTDNVLSRNGWLSPILSSFSLRFRDDKTL
jgi:hypothetical protein